MLHSSSYRFLIEIPVIVRGGGCETIGRDCIHRALEGDAEKISGNFESNRGGSMEVSGWRLQP